MKKLFTKKELLASGITIVLCTLGLFFSLWFIQEKGLDFRFISQDPANYYQVQPYLGILSSIGIMLWGVSFMALVMTWYLGRVMKKEIIEIKLCLYFGLLSLLLYMDDFFMIHDWLITRFLHLPGTTIMAFYAISVAVLVLKNFRILRGNGLLYIAVSYLGLGASGLIDMVHDKVEFNNAFFYEDGAKLIGICFWTLFALTFAIKQIKRLSFNIADKERELE
jgi:hypothetical protein